MKSYSIGNCFYIFFLFFFSSHIIHHELSLPSYQHPLTPTLSPDPLLLSFPSEKSSGVMEQGITRFSKTRPKSSSRGWLRQPSRRTRVPRAGKRVTDTLSPIVPQTLQAKQPQRICTGPSSDPCGLHDCHFSLYEPVWALLRSFVGCCLVSLTPLKVAILPVPILEGFLSSA